MLRLKYRTFSSFQRWVELNALIERRLHIMKLQKKTQFLRQILHSWMFGAEQANQEEIDHFTLSRYFR
jgi:hypothetical protein